MAYGNALAIYKETKIKTAGQGQLIVMLYEEAVRSLDRGLELLLDEGKRDPGKIEATSKAVLKAQEIISELMASLDFDKGGKIARNLFSLYTWFNQELLRGNIDRDAHRITVVRNLLDDLRVSWVEVARKTQIEGNTRVGVNIAG